MNVAVIPARGGSKRIPKKNIKPFCGKPIVAYSIETAIASKLFDRVIVSTDDKEIADIVIQYGAEAPFTRPADLSDDYAGTATVVGHTVKWMMDKGYSANSVCCIYATAPLIRSDDLIRSYEVFQTDKWDYVFSATEYAYPIQRSFRIRQDGSVEMFSPEKFIKRSQDLEKAYHDAGQFYWGKPNAWLKGVKMFGPTAAIYELPPQRVQDIDTAEDWKRAELLYQLI